MQFEECTFGEFRVFAGTLESALGDGFIAALVVMHGNLHQRTLREIFRDESLACGHRWATAESALAYAMNKAHDVIRQHEPLLTA